MMIYATVSVWGDDKGKKSHGRTVVGETVADVSELALLNVLLDRVESLLLGDLHLGIGPSGNLNDHYRLKAKKRQRFICKWKKKETRRTVEDSLGLVGEERNVASYPESTSLDLAGAQKEGKGK